MRREEVLEALVLEAQAGGGCGGGEEDLEAQAAEEFAEDQAKFSEPWSTIMSRTISGPTTSTLTHVTTCSICSMCLKRSIAYYSWGNRQHPPCISCTRVSICRFTN